MSQAVGVRSFTLAPWRLRQVDLCDGGRQPGLHDVFQVSQGYVVRPCLKQSQLVLNLSGDGLSTVHGRCLLWSHTYSEPRLPWSLEMQSGMALPATPWILYVVLD